MKNGGVEKEKEDLTYAHKRERDILQKSIDTKKRDTQKTTTNTYVNDTTDMGRSSKIRKNKNEIIYDRGPIIDLT